MTRSRARPATVGALTLREQMTEKAFMAMVIEVATLYKFRVYHTHDSRRSAHGYPDLAMIREHANGTAEYIMAEVKTERGKVTAEQAEWLRLLPLAGIRCYLWRPRDWDALLAILRPALL